MLFWFNNKKKSDSDQNDANKKRSIESFEAGLSDSSRLSKEEMDKLGGGKGNTRSRYDDDPNFQSTFTSTIPS